MKRVDCVHRQRLIEIRPGLMLTECCSSGELSSRLGAVDAARELVEKQGGFPALRDRVELGEKRMAEERKQARSGYARPA